MGKKSEKLKKKKSEEVHVEGEIDKVKQEVCKSDQEDNIILQELTDSLNDEPVKLLLLIWTIVGDDIKDGKVLSINKMGFEFELIESQGTIRVERYEFDAEGKDPLPDVDAVKKEVTSLQNKSRVAVLPINVGIFLFLFLWLLILCGTSESPELGSKYVQTLRWLCHSIFQNAEYTKIAMYILLLSHMCEALYAYTLLSKMKLDKFCKLSWGALIIVFGFPVTKQVVFLHEYWTRKCTEKKLD